MSDAQIFQEKQEALEEQERMVAENGGLFLLLPLQSHLGRRQRHSGVQLFSTPALPDKALLKAIARARHWRALLLNGEVSSIDEIAVRSKLDRSRARFILRLAFLNPTLTRSIANGKQTGLRLISLLEMPFPIIWREQKEYLFSKLDSGHHPSL
jgi:hypothetical protein